MEEQTSIDVNKGFDLFIQALNPDNTLIANRYLVHAIGTKEALIYQNLISKETYFKSRNMLDEQGFFFATVIDIQESTGYTERQQKPAVDKLTELGLIETQRKGLPARKYYKIIKNFELLKDLLDKGKLISEQLKQCRNKNQQNVGTGSNLMLEQEPTKCRNKEQPYVGTVTDKMSEHKHNINKHNINNLINQSIHQSTENEKKIDGLIDSDNATVNNEDYQKYKAIIKQNIDYDVLVENNADTDTVDEMVDIMAETIAFNKQKIKINGNYISAEIVKSRFLKINSSDIEYVLEAMAKNTTKIKNIRGYIISTLYNSKNTINSYYRAEVNHDLYGNR